MEKWNKKNYVDVGDIGHNYVNYVQQGHLNKVRKRPAALHNTLI